MLGGSCPPISVSGQYSGRGHSSAPRLALVKIIPSHPHRQDINICHIAWLLWQARAVHSQISPQICHSEAATGTWLPPSWPHITQTVLTRQAGGRNTFLYSLSGLMTIIIILLRDVNIEHLQCLAASDAALTLLELWTVTLAHKDH